MYNALAKFYDLFMQDVDYDAWIDFVTSQIGNERKTGLDFGCGTGRFATALAKKGYAVCGVDLSPQMLSLAAESARRQGVIVPFLQGDICSFCPGKPMDFVLAMCDTLNYIAKPVHAFENVYACLKKGGMFVFDVSSPYKLQTILAGQTYSETEDDITYIWSSVGGKRKVDMFLTFFEPTEGGMYRKTEEQQTQYVHSCDELTTALKAAGFGQIKCVGETRRSAPREKDTRIHFIATK